MAVGGKAVTTENFALLDGLRGLGAILVLVGHTLMFWGPVRAPSGAVIVDLFFVLSGFVIAFSYEAKFNAGMGPAEFMIQRIVRLYPLYLLGTVTGFVVLLALAIGDKDFGPRSQLLGLQLLPELFVLPAPEWMSPKAYPLNAPAWTLFFEIGVNLLYVLAYRWLKNTRLLMGVVAACAAALAFTVFHFGSIDAGSDWKSFSAGFARAGFGFFAGVLTYRLLGSPRTTKRPRTPWAMAILIVLPLACFAPATPELRPFVDLGLAIGLSMPLLWLCQSVAPPAGFAGLMSTGGRVSYAIYILQQPFREIMARLEWRYPDVLKFNPLGGIAVLLAVVTFAYFAEKWYDRPLRRFIVAKLRERSMRRAISQGPRPMAPAE